MAMPHRYRIAQAMGKDALAQAVREDTELLKHFGLKLLSLEGGVNTAVEEELDADGKIHPWNVLEINDKLWDWLRPVLVTARASQRRDQSLSLAAK